MGISLYEIDEQLQNAIEFNVDENGEILEGEELTKKIDALEMELNDKLVNIACLIKSLDAEAEAIKNEKMKLAKRQKTVENKAEWLKKYIDTYLKNTVAEPLISKFKIKDPRAVIGFRKSTVVEIPDESKVAKKYLIPQPSKVDKTKIKNDLKNGIKVKGASLVEKENLSIK